MMADLSAYEVRDWLADRAGGEPPPIFELWTSEAPSARSRPEEVADVLRTSLGAQTWLVPGSGAVQFRLEVSSPIGEWAAHSADLLVPLMDACQAADERSFDPVDLEPGASGALVAAVRSRLPDADLPVIGPGGGATVFADRNALDGEVVVRRRTATVGHGRWRRPSEILRDLAALGPIDLDDVRFVVELGYFEAAARATQQVMRPVYLFVIERVQPEQAGAGWRRALAVPATTDDERPLSLGLETWWEGE